MSVRESLIAGTIILCCGTGAALAQAPARSDPAPSRPIPFELTGSVKVAVEPGETQVYIDGYYAGLADDLDGAFQELHIEPGEHDIQLFLPGYRLHVEHIVVRTGVTSTVRHSMERLEAGEPEAPRPAAAPQPPRRFAGAGEPAAASSGDYGSVSIRVQPGDAEVLVDNSRWDAPVEGPLVVQLAPGPHTIEVRKDGYRDFLTEVTIRPGETTPLNVSLARTP